MPRFLTSANTASIPFLSIIRRPLRDIRRRTHLFSLSAQNFRTCRLGLKVLLFRLFAWDTLFPETARLPVIWHSLDIFYSRSYRQNRGAIYSRILAPMEVKFRGMALEWALQHSGRPPSIGIKSRSNSTNARAFMPIFGSTTRHHWLNCALCAI